jgi:hypothetical protein
MTNDKMKSTKQPQPDLSLVATPSIRHTPSPTELGDYLEKPTWDAILDTVGTVLGSPTMITDRLQPEERSKATWQLNNSIFTLTWFQPNRNQSDNITRPDFYFTCNEKSLFTVECKNYKVDYQINFPMAIDRIINRFAGHPQYQYLAPMRILLASKLNLLPRDREFIEPLFEGMGLIVLEIGRQITSAHDTTASGLVGFTLMPFVFTAIRCGVQMARKATT